MVFNYSVKSFVYGIKFKLGGKWDLKINPFKFFDRFKYYKPSVQKLN